MEKYSNYQFLKDVWSFIRDYKVRFILFSILLIISVIIGLAPPFVLAKVINFFISGGSNLNYFYMLLGVLLAIFIADTFLRLIAKYYLEILSNTLQNKMKIKSFERLMQGDLIWHDKEKTGNKIQRISAGELALKDFLSLYIHRGLGQIITTIGVLTVFMFLGIKYLAFAVLFLFVFLFLEIMLNKKVAKKSLELKKLQEEAGGQAFEIASNISSVKALGIERQSNKKVFDIEGSVLDAKNSRRKVGIIKQIILMTVSGFFFVGFLFMVGVDILSGIFAAGIFIIYVDYFTKLQGFLGTVSKETNKLIDIKIGFRRLMEIYHSIPEVKEEHAKKLHFWKKISFRDVGFSYREKKNILENFNLEIKRGEKVGVVGKSGSGKSTFFKLLLKLYLTTKGDIFFDDKSIRKVKRDSLLSGISYVPQETELFNTSIKGNITISNSARDSNLYEKVLKISMVGKFLSKFKKGDKTVLGEKGSRVSGGERQRIGIARALYKNSDILVLDEATSNLDYGTEKKIQDGLNTLKNKTMIVSAHRLSTLRHMDKIIYLEKGKIIEQGSYNELLKKKGKFWKLWKSQEKL